MIFVKTMILLDRLSKVDYYIAHNIGMQKVLHLLF